MICMIIAMTIFVYVNVIQLYKESKRHADTMTAIKHKFRQDREKIRNQYTTKLRSYRNKQ